MSAGGYIVLSCKLGTQNKDRSSILANSGFPLFPLLLQILRKMHKINLKVNEGEDPGQRSNN